MTCTHDLAEKETACADGWCPICLQSEVIELRAEIRVLLRVMGDRPPAPTMDSGVMGPTGESHECPGAAGVLPLARTIEDVDGLYEAIKDRLLRDADPRMRAVFDRGR